MRTTAFVTQMVLRLCFLVLLVLGVLFWTGRALSLVNVHMAIGSLFVIGLWIMAVLGARARVGMGLVANAAIGGFIVLGLGMTQTAIMPGGVHWVVRVVHLLVGMAAIGISERIGARIKT
jgi:hypothetical protein